MDILTTQRRMGQKYLERLLRKLRSMDLTVPGAADHLLYIQHALNQSGAGRAWISPNFNRELMDCKALTLQAASRLTHLAEIVCREPPIRGSVTRLG